MAAAAAFPSSFRFSEQQADLISSRLMLDQSADRKPLLQTGRTASRRFCRPPCSAVTFTLSVGEKLLRVLMRTAHLLSRQPALTVVTACFHRSGSYYRTMSSSISSVRFCDLTRPSESCDTTDWWALRPLEAQSGITDRMGGASWLAC